MKRLRIKTYLTILPIIIAAVAISGYLSFMQSKTALTRLANHHLAYKAEQLRDYLNSEWQIVVDLGLSERPEYRGAQEASFRTYAYSLLRSGTEQILVFGPSGAVEARVGGDAESVGQGARETDEAAEPPSAGWFSRNIGGEDRVGIAFGFEPFRWTVAVTEFRSLFFSEIDDILKTQLWVLLASIAGASLLATVYLRYVTGPLERLAADIDLIARTGDLSHRATIEFRDEIGLLAHRFNIFVSTIETQEVGMVNANRAERQARETAVQREEETLYLLGRVSDYKDESTGAHLARIGELSALFARLLGRDEEEEELLRKSSPLHDIGKIGIPEAVLLKPGSLTREEFDVIKRHTVLGYELLKDAQSRYLVEGATIALSHHECWDGSGYPRGSAAEAIPLKGRIVSIVDVFDALTSPRPYKEAWPTEKALDYIVGQREKRFDPDLVDLFRSHFSSFADTLRRSS